MSTSEAGSSPRRRSSPSSPSTPRSATRNERMPEREPAPHLGDRVVDAGVTARHAAGCGRHERLAARVPCAPRAEEERDLDPRVGPQRDHLPDLLVGQHHHAAALRDAPNRDGASLGLLEHGGQHQRPLDRRDLDPVAQAVGEAGVAHLRETLVIRPRTSRRRLDRSGARGRAARDRPRSETAAPARARASGRGACRVRGTGPLPGPRSPARR